MDGDDPVDRLRYALRCRRYSTRTEESYAFWAIRFLAFCRQGNVAPDTRPVREPLGHSDVATTMIHPHVPNRPGLAVRSREDG